MSEQLTGCHPPHLLLHRLHPSPVLYCESQRQPGRVSVVCVRACVRSLCMCVAADQRQLGGGGGRWYLVPPPTSPPLCICPSQFEQRGFFFFCLPPSSSSSLLPTHWFRESKRGREKRKKERERETRPLPAREPSYSATVELIKLMHTAAGMVLCVHVFVYET